MSPPSSFLGRSLADSLARSPALPLHRISISVFHSIALSHLSALLDASHPPSTLVVCVCASRGLSLPHLSTPLLSHPTARSPVLSACIHEKKNGEKRPWLGMESLATHPRLIPLFSRKSSVAPRSESSTAQRTRSECGWIKLELQRMIGQSLTRLCPFLSARSLAEILARRMARYDKYRGTSAHF